MSKSRVEEELKIVEAVACLIGTDNITETNNLIYACTVVVTERLGIRPRRKKEDIKSLWKRRLQGQLNELRKHLSQLMQISKQECNKRTIKTELEIKYGIKSKGLANVIEELKQRITAKAAKVKKYEERIRQYQQNRLFVTNQRQFYKQIDQLDESKQPMPIGEESKLFWSKLWANPVEHNKEAAWLKDMKNDQQVQTRRRSHNCGQEQEAAEKVFFFFFFFFYSP